ncbi:hypothetical protein ACA30_13440 [Virgibacillus soli]|nr:hypothetical protein ACA30_13440 [Virgibacillus soli]
MSLDLGNMTAVQNVGGEQILGHLMWFSVGKQLVKSSDLLTTLQQAGLEESWMPNPIRSTDAFRRATKEVETKKATGQANVFENYLIREVFADREQVQRNLVVETVDQSGKRLNYDSQAGIITLNKKNDSLTFVTSDNTAKELCEEVEIKFNVYKEHYSAQQVRVMVSKILQSLAPTPVRPNGGIYFVPDSHTEGLNKLVNFTSALENSEGFKIPVVNTYDNQQMVNKKLNEHLESILKECQSSEHLRKSQVKDLVNHANAVIKDYKNYKNIVQNESDYFEDKILLIKSEVMKLIENME